MVTGTMTSAFLEKLNQSGLLNDQQHQDLTQLVQEVGLDLADNRAVATWCVKERYLTRFQANQLLAGKWRNFIVNNKYKVLDQLGQGGMGTVFRAEHMTLRKEVALKVLPSELTTEPASLQRFLREAQALAALDHPNIVQAHDVDETRGLYFIVMSCVEGRTLEDTVRQDGPLPVAVAAACIAQTCRGLQHAYEAGWVHRDLKPSNLILDIHGSVKITDFGLARLELVNDGCVTQQHDAPSLLGSPDYISPEQAMSREDIDIRADIYSLGATFYFLLTGRAPFENERLIQKLMAHQVREPQDVTYFRSDIPAALIPILKKMMAKKREERYHTPRDVEEALTPFLQEPSAHVASTTLNRVRGAKTLRAPKLERVTLPKAPSSVSHAPYHEVPPAPVADHYGISEPEPEGLSPRTKRILAVSGAAAGLVTCVILLILWLTAAPDREARLAQVDQLGRQKHWDQAARLLADLMRETPDDSKDRKELYSRIKDWPAVAALLLEQFPNDKELNQVAARQFAQQGDYAKAIACLEKYGLADSDNPALWYQLASYAVRLRDWPKAAQALEKACRGKPDQHEWCRNLAFVYAAMRDTENYQRVCGEMLAKFGDRGQSRRLRLEVGYACSMGTHDSAQLEAVLKLGQGLYDEDARGPMGLFDHCSALYRAGKYAEALRLLEDGDTFKTNWPFQPFCQPLIAMCQYRLGRTEEARKTLTQHRHWLKEETAKTLRSRTESTLAISWEALAMENLTREAEELIEGKGGARL